MSDRKGKKGRKPPPKKSATLPRSAAYERLIREVERPHHDRRTPLMKAASDGDVARVRALLAKGAAVDAVTSHDPESLFYEGGRTALMTAAHGGHLKVAELLLDADAHPPALLDAVADDGDTALTCAAAGGSLEVVERLLDRGAQARPPGAKFTPLYHAAHRGDAPMARRLIERLGAPCVDEPIWTGTTPLMAAAGAGSREVVDLLLASGAAVDARDQKGRTALMHAVVSDLGDVELMMRHDPVALARIHDVVVALLRAGADVRLRDASAESALDLVADRTVDFVDVARSLVEAGAEVNARGGAPGRTPLSRASAMQATLVAASLLEAGADPNLRDEDGATPLLNAASNGYPDMVQLLVEAGADTRGAPTAARKNHRREVLPRLDEPERKPLAVPQATAHATTRAGEQFARGEYADALATYMWIPRLVRERVPGIAANMAYCLQSLGDHGEALRHFDLALARKPGMSHAWRAACFSSYEREDWSEMARYALRATELLPEDDYAWQQLAIARSQLGQHRKAAEAGRHAIRIRPTNGYAAANLALDLRKLGQASWKQTIVRAFELLPELGEDAELAQFHAEARAGLAGGGRRTPARR
jgi:ankyrin repeat protein